MSNSDRIEEIMYEAYNLNVQRKVFDLSKKYISKGELQVDAYEKALRSAKESIRRDVSTKE